MLQVIIETYLLADDLILESECFSVKVKIPQSVMLGWIRNYLQQVYNHAREALSIKREDEGVCQDLNPYSTFS
ncbi:MAG: hypothetical protein QNK14_10660 [Desulfobacterales bacterium]|nr:hypothetical protein [Desulfobacterales bacterium]